MSMREPPTFSTTRRTEDLNVLGIRPLPSPKELKRALPLSPEASESVTATRQAIREVLAKRDARLLVIAGPCSIHDPEAALEYAGRLNGLRRELEDQLVIVMRAYFEKPRTTIGWKGLISDPQLDGGGDMAAGLRKARQTLLSIAEMGMGAATEVLDPIVPQYVSDLVSWAAIGARTTESQTHRELASGLSMPVGFKNSTDGNQQIAVNAMLSARQPHCFLGMDAEGRIGVVQTCGNPWSHIILRGGGGRPNYDPVSVAETEDLLRAAGLEPLIVVDCSHANCGRRHELQSHVLKDVVQQRIENNSSVVGVMLESNLVPGNQPFQSEASALQYGLSITDPCLGWEGTEALLRYAAERLPR